MRAPVETLAAADPDHWTPEVVRAAGWLYDEFDRWLGIPDLAEGPAFTLGVACLAVAADVGTDRVVEIVGAHRATVAALTSERFAR